MDGFLIANTVILWVVVIFNLLLTLALIKRLNNTTQDITNHANLPGLQPGTLAPNFEALSLQNQLVTLADYTQRKIAFVFISPTCQPCLEKLSDLEQLGANVNHQSDRKLILIIEGGLDEVKGFIEQYRLTLPILVSSRRYNEARNIWHAYRVHGTPFYCIIDKTGRVQTSGWLEPDWERLITQAMSSVEPKPTLKMSENDTIALYS